MARKLFILAVAAIVSMVVALPAGAGPPGELLGTIDIDIEDGEGECEYDDEGGAETVFEDAAVKLVVNSKWIIGTCHAELDDDAVAALGGPASKALVYQGFDCELGVEGETDDDIEATMSRATLTPSGNLSVTCKAPLPDDD